MPIRYDLRVTQTMIDSGRGDFLEGMKRIDGRVFSPGNPHFGYSKVGKYFTLHLSDGRTLDLFFTDADGSIASCGSGLISPKT